MSKPDSPNDREENKEVVIIDTEDAVEFDDGSKQVQAGDEQVADSATAGDDSPAPAASEDAQADNADVAEDREAVAAEADQGQPPPPAKPRRSWSGLFNFLLILALAGAGGYYWWMQQQRERDYRDTIAALERELQGRVSNSQLDSRLDDSLAPLRSGVGELQQKVETFGVEQQSLREASEKLYELYGRDKNDWQLAEVEYLMRVAQHKLILQDDFEGAAITLQAASDKIALTADPGLLPVRVMISEEIADLKTRKRPDLVGATLILAQLARQARGLEPGFALRVDEPSAPPSSVDEESGDLLERFNRVVDSLVTIRYQGEREPSVVEANVVNVDETLEDNLKLARWAVLDRDAFQYRRLIDESLRLFREFYDLDNAANSDFLNQLQELQKMQLKPEKPDIGGSLRELQRILSQREIAPEETAPDESGETEAANG